MGGNFWRCSGCGLGQLRRRAKGVITPPGVTADPLLLYTLCTIALLPLATLSQVLALSNWQLACLIFCGLNTLVGYGALAEAIGALAGSSGERVDYLNAIVYAAFFQIYYHWPGPMFSPDRC